MSTAEELAEACREELSCLWSDLDGAVRDALNGKWSIRCDHLVWRIEALTRLVGPTPWDEIQIPLLEAGIYQRVHEEMGIEAPVDMERVAITRRRIDESSARLKARLGR